MLTPGIGSGSSEFRCALGRTCRAKSACATSWRDILPVPGVTKRSLHDSYHSVSSKHLPRYLTEFSYRFNSRFSSREMFPRLAYAALRTPPMPDRVLKLAENHA